jgi:hypothetical protein
VFVLVLGLWRWVRVSLKRNRDDRVWNVNVHGRIRFGVLAWLAVIGGCKFLLNPFLSIQGPTVNAQDSPLNACLEARGEECELT